MDRPCIVYQRTRFCLENCIQTEVQIISETEVTSGLRVCVLQRWKDQESGQYGEGPAPNLIPLGASIDQLPHQWMNAQSTPERLQMSCPLTCRTCNKGCARKLPFTEMGFPVE